MVLRAAHCGRVMVKYSSGEGLTELCYRALNRPFVWPAPTLSAFGAQGVTWMLVEVN